MSLLLYEYCLDQSYLKPKDEQFYDKLRLKSLIFQLESDCDSVYKESPTKPEIKVSLMEPGVKSNSLMVELMEFLHLKEPQPSFSNQLKDKLLNCENSANQKERSISGSFSNQIKDKSVASSFNDKLSTCSHTMSEISTSQSSLAEFTGTEAQLSAATNNILQNLFVQSPYKARSVFELIFKHNRLAQNVFLKGTEMFILLYT